MIGHLMGGIIRWQVGTIGPAYKQDHLGSGGQVTIRVK